MAEDIFNNVPEDVLLYIKDKYEDYKTTAKEPVLDFKTYFFKVYDLAIEIVGLINSKKLIEEDIEILEHELEEVNIELVKNKSSVKDLIGLGSSEEVTNSVDLKNELYK